MKWHSRPIDNRELGKRVLMVYPNHVMYICRIEKAEDGLVEVSSCDCLNILPYKYAEGVRWITQEELEQMEVEDERMDM